MMLDRRHFAKLLGAAAFLAPFMRFSSQAYAAAPSSRRLIVVYSLATNLSLWRPKSAPGQPVQLSAALAPLQSVIGDIVLVDGLTPADPTQTHGTEQAFTGRNNGSANTMSVDQYIASKAGLPAPLLLGVQSASASQFFNTKLSSANGGAMPPNDDPVNAYNLLFGAPVATASGATTVPKSKILDLVTKQLQTMKQGMGSEQSNKLQQHIDAVASLDKSMHGTAMASCTKPAIPNLGGMDHESQSASIPVGEAQQDLIVGALGCDLTRVVGMQWGTSSLEYLSGTLNYDEHSAIHSDGQEAKVNAAENYLCTWFANLIKKLRATDDPTQTGKSLLDTTLIIWSRDFAHQAPGVHSNFSMPYVLAGATDYLKTSPQGIYLNYGGDDLQSQTRGKAHEKLLLNCCEAMGINDYSGFGQLSGSDQAPLPEIKV